MNKCSGLGVPDRQMIPLKSANSQHNQYITDDPTIIFNHGSDVTYSLEIRIHDPLSQYTSHK